MDAIPSTIMGIKVRNKTIHLDFVQKFVKHSEKSFLVFHTHQVTMKLSWLAFVASALPLIITLARTLASRNDPSTNRTYQVDNFFCFPIQMHHPPRYGKRSVGLRKCRHRSPVFRRGQRVKLWFNFIHSRTMWQHSKQCKYYFLFTRLSLWDSNRAGFRKIQC